MGPDSPAARQIRQQLGMANSTGKAGDLDPVTGRPFYEVQRVDGKGVFLAS